MKNKEIADAIELCEELLTDALQKAQNQCDFCDYVNILEGPIYDWRDRLASGVKILEKYKQQIIGLV